MTVRFRILLRLLFSCLATVALGDGPTNRSVRLDAQGNLVIEVAIPAGSRNAALEISSDLANPAPWRTMIAGAIDGRAATVTFRLPGQPGASRLFARARPGTATTLPAAELADPALVSVVYAGTLGEPEKVNLLIAAGAKMTEWKSLPRVQSQANLIAWAMTQPNVAAAEVSTLADNVCIRFSDGDICILRNKPREAGDTVVPPSALAAAPPAIPLRVPKVDSTLGSLPTSNRTVTAFSLETSFPNSAPTIGGWLNSRGFANTDYASTTIPEILGWSSAASPLGVLFWHAHGCSYPYPNGSQGIAIATRQQVLPDATDPAYAPMRRSGELMLSISEGEIYPRYTLTADFVRNRMHFAPYSLVVLDTCFGSSPELAQAFLEAGAGSYVSWDWLSGNDSGKSCRKIFDRLLGMNQDPPVSTPPERSFAMHAVKNWMINKAYDLDPSAKYPGQTRPNAKLVWYDHPTTPANILRPSIMRVLADAATPDQLFSKYLIEGDFGPDPGAANRSVLWANQPMQVLTWDAQDGIVIRIPAKPPAGNLMVTIQKDYQTLSNQVPITEWTAPFRYEAHDQGSLTGIMDLSVKIRGDIHGSRSLPEDPVEYLDVVFGNMEDCSGTLSAAGFYQRDSNTTITWSGGSALTSSDSNSPFADPLHLVHAAGVMNVASGSAGYFDVAAIGTFTQTTREYDDAGNLLEETSVDATLGMTSLFMFLIQPMPFNPATAVMNPGTRSEARQDGVGVLTWPSVTPVLIPDADTLR